MKKFYLMFLICFLSVSCNLNVNKSYVNALILKAENERNGNLLYKAYLKAGRNRTLIKRIAIASGRIPSFRVFKIIADDFKSDVEITDTLAICSMFNGVNFNKKELTNILSKFAFTQNTAIALLNTNTRLGLNIVLNRNRLLKNKYGDAIAFNLWRARDCVTDEILKGFYKTNPEKTVYSFYRLKKKGIASAYDLINADLTAKFYGMFVVKDKKRLLDKDWRLKVAYIKATNNKDTAKRFLTDENPLVRKTAIYYFLKNKGNIKFIDLNTLSPSQLEVALSFVADKRIVSEFFDKGGFFSYVSAPFMPKKEKSRVLNSEIPVYYKLKFIEKTEGLQNSAKMARDYFKRTGDKQALIYLVEKLENGKLKPIDIVSLVGDNEDKFYSILLDAGLVKKRIKTMPLSYYLGVLEKIRKIRGFKIQTEKGDIICRFFTKKAPLTCLNFYNLSQKGYFNGLFFHRVVPAFVAQDGDKTGTGYGGPDYSIRCEYNTLKYFKEGMVGMALSGKDTGGSQYFITHIATPHLNYNYTIFAEVVKGLDVLPQIDKFTRIKKVKCF